MNIGVTFFGEFNGKDVYRFTLTNANGNSVSIISYGAAIISWIVKDSEDECRNIVAGFDNLEDYVKNDVYMGCIAGRYANRIANGKFKINGTEYLLTCNNAVNHLHGGNTGFDKVIWDAEIVEGAIPRLVLTYFSKDGEEGYPGNLKVKVEYSYNDNDELLIEYFAKTDKSTPVNLTSHCYFNLTGDISQDILSHSLQINAKHYTAVNENQIPTGELTVVDDTGFDFNIPRRILKNFTNTTGGYDHNFALNRTTEELLLAAILSDPENELKMSVFTTEPGMQFYSGNLLDGSLINRDGKSIGRYAALCLETQHFPDSPNHPHFPSTILHPGEKYHSTTLYKIDLANDAESATG